LENLLSFISIFVDSLNHKDAVAFTFL